MKNSSFIVALLSATILVSFSCRKERHQQNSNNPVVSAIIRPLDPNLIGVLGTGHNVSDTIQLTSPANGGLPWRLQGMVYVDSGDVLICQCGTT